MSHFRFTLALVVAVGSLLHGCSSSSDACTSDADCPGAQTCAVTGGVLFGGGTCITGPTIVVTTDAGDASRDTGDMWTGGDVDGGGIQTEDSGEMPVDTGVPDVGVDVEALIDRYRAALWKQACEAAFECPGKRTIDLVIRLGRYSSKEACQNAPPHPGFGRLDRIEESLRRGYLAPGEQAYVLAESCAADHRDHWCEGQPLGEECAGLFRSRSDLGEACLTSLDCPSEAFCLIDSGCLGTCTLRTDYEDDCAGVAGVCPDGEVCAENTCQIPTAREDGATCQHHEQCGDNSICTALDGACLPISFASEGEACDVEYYADFCEPGLACRQNETGQLRCAQPAEQNESCVEWFECRSGLSCFALMSGASCQPPADLDAPCATDEQCRGPARCEQNRCVLPENCRF